MLWNLLPQCVIPENIHTSPTEGIFFLRPPPPLWKFQFKRFIHFFINILALQSPPLPPWKFQSLLWGEYGHFLELRNIASGRVIYSIIAVQKWRQSLSLDISVGILHKKCLLSQDYLSLHQRMQRAEQMEKEKQNYQKKCCQWWTSIQSSGTEQILTLFISFYSPDKLFLEKDLFLKQFYVKVVLLATIITVCGKSCSTFLFFVCILRVST